MATFKKLKQELDITDGNLDAHLKKLLTSDYLVSKKQPTKKGRPQTLYQRTPTVLSPIFKVHD